jgi:hypothetical protein
MSNGPFNTNFGTGLPHSPGAYMINSGRGAFPIFCTIQNFNSWGMNDQDNYYIVLPGFTLILATTSLDSSGIPTSGGTSYTLDNKNGTTILYVISPTVDLISSCKLQFEYTEIKWPGITGY